MRKYEEVVAKKRLALTRWPFGVFYREIEGRKMSKNVKKSTLSLKKCVYMKK